MKDINKIRTNVLFTCRAMVNAARLYNKITDGDADKIAALFSMTSPLKVIHKLYTICRDNECPFNMYNELVKGEKGFIVIAALTARFNSRVDYAMRFIVKDACIDQLTFDTHEQFKAFKIFIQEVLIVFNYVFHHIHDDTSTEDTTITQRN